MGLPELAGPARRIVFDLVHNAVVHAGTAIRVDVARRGRYLYVSVRDGSRLPPRLLPYAEPATWTPASHAGTGLRVVDHDGKRVLPG